MRRQIIAFKEVKKSVKSKNVFLFMNFDINSKISFIFKKQRQSRDRQTAAAVCLHFSITHVQEFLVVLEVRIDSGVKSVGCSFSKL